ncbi:MAG: diguanylate cyclase [Candidatus Eremiobacteraeota bacterium]|nr:diguanylate cyclase [Candidatus Eremiobacteraeota bacterium]MCW5866426.1 diguanylate cyclase [Candidatus Eremiobacteraeota bacterium]
MLDIPGVQVVSELGRGARGVVYRGRARDLEVAVKVPRLDRAEEGLAFRREGSLLASVSHPGLARVYEVGHSGPTSFIISEFIDGTTLAEELRLGALPVSRVELLAVTMAGALNEVHRRNLVHRDIKPHNIIWGGSGPKLIDFGLAAWDSQAVAGGEFSGTLLYASPEQTGMLKRPVDGRSDLYSLGMVLFECLVGRPPFWGEPADLIRQHAVVIAPAVHELDPRVSPALSAVVARLLAKDPDDRYPSAYALWLDLQQLGALERGEKPLPAPAWASPERPLVGRSSDLTSLREAWLPTTVGHGGVALVVGNPGSGKSRLIREFLRSLPGPAILPAKCDQEAGLPFGAIHEALISGAFGALVRFAPEASRQATQRVVAANPEQSQALSYWIPVYKELVQEGAQAAGDFLRDIHEILGRWLAEFARAQGGLVVVLEDVQWADEGMLQFLLHLSPHLNDSPLFLVLSAREWEGPLRILEGGFGGLVRARVQVRALDSAETGQFLESYLGAPSMPEICAWIYRQSQGNPFAIEQYLRTCLDQAALQPHWGQWVADMTALRALNLPQDIFELIQQRLHALGPETLGVLRTAAVLGGHFDEKLLGRLVPGDGRMLRDSLAQSVAQGALERRGEGPYRFAHDRIRESFLSHWNARDLKAEHLRIAECLEQATRTSANRMESIYACARHFVAGEGPGEKIFRSCWLAAHWARRQCAFDSAYEFLQHCLSHAPPDRRYQVFDALAEACEMTGRVEQAFHYLGEALSLDIPPLDKARCRLRRCQMGLQNPEWGAGGRELGQAFAELGARAPAGGKSSLWASLRHYLGYVLGRPLAARPAAEDLTVLAQLYDQTTVVGYYRGDIPRTLESVAVGLRLSLTLGPTRETVRSLCLMSFVTAIGHWHRLSDYYLSVAEQRARDLMDPVSLRRVKAFRGLAYFQRNRVLEALDIFWEALFAEGPRLPMSDYSTVLGALTWAHMLRGDFHKVLEVLERARHMFAITDRPLPTEIRLLEAYQVVAHSAFERVVDFTPFVSDAKSVWQDLSVPGCYLIALLFRGEWGTAAEPPLRAIEAALAGELPMHVKHALVARAYIWMHRTQHSENRAEPLRCFGQTLLELSVSSRQELLAGHAMLLRAAWLRFQKRFQLARMTLEQAQRVAEKLDSRWLYLEVFSERSRLLADLGQKAAARSAAQMALSLAQREGWNERARQLAREASLPWGRGNETEVTRGGASGLIQRRQLEALRELSLASAKVFDPARLAHLVLGQVIQLMGAQRALLLLFQGDYLQVVAARTQEGPVEGSQMGYSRTVVDTVVSQRRSVIVNGAQEGLQLGAQSVVAQDLRSVLVSPLRLRDSLVGVIYLDNSATRGLFDEDDQELLEAMASHVAVGLESARALQIEFQLKVERGHRQVAEKLRDFATQLSMCGSLEEILTLLRITISQETGLEDFCAVLPEGAGIRCLMGEVQQRDSLIEEALRQERLVQRENSMVVPCTGRNGPVALLCLSGSPEQQSERAREFIETVARQSALAMDQVLLVRQLIEIATTDALTGVSNRRHFLDLCERELAKTRRYKTPLSLIILDIDHFKKFNDTYGHDVGDDVLRTVAQALKHELRTEDILARYGGEEFVVLLPETPLGDALSVAAERLRKRIENTPLETVHGSLKITISLGVATFSEARNDIRTILKRADEGLYAAKQRGRNQSVALADDES